MDPLPAPPSRASVNLARILFLELCVFAFVPSCGGQQRPAANSSLDLKVSQNDFGAKFDRSRCDDKGKQVVSLDANGDGKPDVIKLFLSVSQDGHTVQQLVCKQTGLDFDGKIDLVQYYGSSGQLFMDEYSMDYSGKFNGRTFFQDGKKVRAEKDMNFDGKPDYFETSRVRKQAAALRQKATTTQKPMLRRSTCETNALFIRTLLLTRRPLGRGQMRAR